MFCELSSWNQYIVMVKRRRKKMREKRQHVEIENEPISSPDKIPSLEFPLWCNRLRSWCCLAVAQVQSPAKELPYAAGVAKKKKKFPPDFYMSPFLSHLWY